MWLLYVLNSIIAILIVLLIVILIRTFTFNPKPYKTFDAENVSFDKESAVKSLQTLLKFKTISNVNSVLEDDNEFEGLIKSLYELYPNVFKLCTIQRFDGRALLIKWQGKNSNNPAVMMSHYDVVPVNEEMWSVPPFEGVIKDGSLWGRGALDTKSTLNASLFACNKLISDGYVPENDVYIAISGGEEINGVGALNIVNYFKENNIEPVIVLDEGGAVVENVFPGVKSSCALIGIAEKGMINVEYKCKSNGGHASAPKPHTPVGLLSRACCKVENNPFKTRKALYG